METKVPGMHRHDHDHQMLITIAQNKMLPKSYQAKIKISTTLIG